MPYRLFFYDMFRVMPIGRRIKHRDKLTRFPKKPLLGRQIIAQAMNRKGASTHMFISFAVAISSNQYASAHQLDRSPRFECRTTKEPAI